MILMFLVYFICLKANHLMEQTNWHTSDLNKLQGPPPHNNKNNYKEICAHHHQWNPNFDSKTNTISQHYNL